MSTNTQDELKEACSSILSLPPGYITKVSNERGRILSIPDHQSSENADNQDSSMKQLINTNVQMSVRFFSSDVLPL